MATPKFEDTVDVIPKFDDTRDISESPSVLVDSYKDTVAGALKGSLLSKIAPALGSIPRSIVSGESIPEAYDRLSQPLEQDIKIAEERSPVLSTVGEIAGVVVPAAPISAASKAITAGKELGTLGRMALGAGEGAAIGATSSIANDSELGPEALAGAAIGAASPAILKVGGKALDAVKDSKLSKAFQLGREGVDLGNVERVASRAKEKVQESFDSLQKVMSTIGKMREEAIDSATKSGTKISVAGALPFDEAQISQSLNQYAGLLPNKSAVMDVLKPFMNEGKELTPREAAELNTKLNDLSSKLYGTNVFGVVKEMQDKLRTQFNQIPGLEKANKLYSQFLSSGVEPILSKGLDDVEKTSYSSLSKPDLNLYKKLQGMIKGLGEDNLESVQTKQSLAKKLGEFGEKNPEILEASGFGSTDDYIKKLEKAGKESSLYPVASQKGELELTKPVKSASSFLKPTKIASKIGNYSRYFYEAPPEVLQQAGQKLITNQSTKNLGEGLMRAIESGDNLKKNAAIFALLQNPNARNILGLEEGEK